MRLSEVLSNAPDTSKQQVEGFLGSKRMSWGRHKNIKVGRIIRNYVCYRCGVMRTFTSQDTLSCLVTSNSTVSIDSTLRCAGCGASTEIWFLVGCDGDLFGPAPEVYLERFTENKRQIAENLGVEIDQIDELFERADIAYHANLGAGSIVYLRKIFELVTTQTARVSGIEFKSKRPPFNQQLEAVDKKFKIIPTEFSVHGYQLFRELSDIMHGESAEDEALRKFKPCRDLVFGIVDKARNSQRLIQASSDLGWDTLPYIEGESQ